MCWRAMRTRSSAVSSRSRHAPRAARFAGDLSTSSGSRGSRGKGARQNGDPVRVTESVTHRRSQSGLKLARNRPLSSNTPPQKSSRSSPLIPAPKTSAILLPSRHGYPASRGSEAGPAPGSGKGRKSPRPGFARRFPSAGRCCCCGRAIAQRADQAVAERVCGQKPLNGALARATYPILHEALASAPSEACRNGRRADTN
jgi:hypothetical protein